MTKINRRNWQNNMNMTLKAINKWVQVNNMIINVDKTRLSLRHNKYNFLTWEKHIDKTCSKTNILILKWLAGKKWDNFLDTLNKTYTTYIEPASSMVTKLQRDQNKCRQEQRRFDSALLMRSRPGRVSVGSRWYSHTHLQFGCLFYLIIVIIKYSIVGHLLK